jgi:hypothetical protein
MKPIVCLTAVLFAFTSGLRAQEKPRGETKPAEAKAADGKTVDLEVGSLTFKSTAPWVAKKTARMMSAGGFTIPGKDKAAGVEADFYHFAGDGGGGDVDANIKRWQGQFEPGDDGNLPTPKKEEVTLGGKKVLFVTLKGTFLSGSVMDAKRTPLPGYTMTGIIIQTDDGSIFIKINAPDAVMKASEADVKKLVGSAFAATK